MAKTTNNRKTTSSLGFEAELWAAADALRNNMGAAEYEHVVVGLIFLKYIFDAFEAQLETLLDSAAKGANPEDPDEYRSKLESFILSSLRDTLLPKLISSELRANDAPKYSNGVSE